MTKVNELVIKLEQGVILFIYFYFIFLKLLQMKQKNRWKPRMLPKWLLFIKGRTCNPTPLVHQDMTKKTTFYGENKER